MRENTLGPEVLDAGHHPTLEFRGRYAGTRSSGTLEGELVVRGVPRRFSMGVEVAGSGGKLVATGVWEGRLTDLGIKPFKALLGALKLQDWIRLRLHAVFE
jgi:polyisoprenoid-binding protein YceI